MLSQPVSGYDSSVNCVPLEISKPAASSHSRKHGNDKRWAEERREKAYGMKERKQKGQTEAGVECSAMSWNNYCGAYFHVNESRPLGISRQQ